MLIYGLRHGRGDTLHALVDEPADENRRLSVCYELHRPLVASSPSRTPSLRELAAMSDLAAIRAKAPTQLAVVAIRAAC